MSSPNEIVVQKIERKVEISFPGTQGPSGPGILNGNGIPNPDVGGLGEFYLDIINLVIYGPKSTSGWGTGTTIIGPQGPQGDPGTGAAVFTQSTPSQNWIINHNLEFYPNITVVDSAGTAVEGSYTFVNVNTIIATFTSEFSGKAYLS